MSFNGIKINDLPSAPVSPDMQLETDIEGEIANKININNLTNYIAGQISGGFAWNVVDVNTNIIANNGYIINSSSKISLTLPVTNLAGSTFKILGFGSGGFRINQNESQIIYFGNKSTTLGTDGYISSFQNQSSLVIIAINDNIFMVESCIGNFNLQ